MYIFDSIKKSKILFKPIKNGEVSIYVCGPTVYDNAHIGHAKSALTFDLLSRVLTEEGYNVTLARNFTDIDDKIINKSNETGQTIQEITEFYIQKYKNEMSALNINAADVEPKATEFINAMEKMIQTLIDKDIAYITSNGDVYFDISKKEEIFKENNDNTINRVEHNPEKRNQKDFALWKGFKKGEPISFKTSFSVGRPGWHIECSAMIESIFNDTIDIHGGGSDLLFPHHENEAAQTKCATGHKLANYWMHNGMVQKNGKKFSKSLGNSFFLKDALEIYDGENLRYYLLSVHYKSDFNFSEEDLIISKKGLDKLYRLKKRVYGSSSSIENKSFKIAFMSALSDDLNVSVALYEIEKMISEFNEKLDNSEKDKSLKREIISNLELIERVMGIGIKNPYEYFQIGVDEDFKNEINELLKERDLAKKERNFELADNIRTELNLKGISIMDLPDGTVWEKA